MISSIIHRDAKGIQQALKEALKKQDPWDKEIEFQRKKWVYALNIALVRSC